MSFFRKLFGGVSRTSATQQAALRSKHVIDTSQLTRDTLQGITQVAQHLKMGVDARRVLPFANRCLATFLVTDETSFYKRSVFQSAFRRMGAQLNVVPANCLADTSGQQWHEMVDTVRVANAHADCIIMDTADATLLPRLAEMCDVPVLKAGGLVDSASSTSGSDPIQAAGDIFAIQSEFGTVDGLSVSFVGDVQRNGAAHSLIHALSEFKVQVNCVCPDGQEVPDDVVAQLPNSAEIAYYDSPVDVLADSDIMYVTPNVSGESKELISTALVSAGGNNLRIMHPQPRGLDIAADVDDMIQAAYYRQAEAGMYARMALINLVSL